MGSNFCDDFMETVIYACFYTVNRSFTLALPYLLTPLYLRRLHKLVFSNLDFSEQLFF